MATRIQENKEHVRRVETAINEQDNELLSEIFAEDLVHQFHGGREQYDGLDEYREHLRAFHEAFPDGTIAMEEMVAEGDHVAVRYTASGTHEDEFMGVPPTGREVAFSGMRIVRLADGKIAEVWGQRDDLGLLVQLGAVDPPAD